MRVCGQMRDGRDSLKEMAVERRSSRWEARPAQCLRRRPARKIDIDFQSLCRGTVFGAVRAVMQK
eukprot:5077243-Prorocentrum_lima.AAC.1